MFPARSWQMAGNTVAGNVVEREREEVPGVSPFAAKVPVVAPRPAPAVRLREFAALGLLIVLADLTLYRGAGYAGLAAFSFAAPLALLLGSPRPRLRGSFWVVGTLLMLLSLRLAWLGSPFAVLIGIVLILAYSLALHGVRPYVSEIVVRALETTIAGGFALAQYGRSLADLGPRTSRIFWLNVLLPASSVILFGTLFVLANPDLVCSVSQTSTNIAQYLDEWIERLSENAGEPVVWLLAAWFGAGLIRPLTHTFPARPLWQAATSHPARQEASPYFVAVRNMLLGVIGLFAVYLVFEFATLWFRKFPPGFYYAGYAHEGAAWLTAALALAT